MKTLRPKLIVPLVVVTAITWVFREPLRTGLALLVAGSITGMSDAIAAPKRGSFNGFNVSNATIPTSEILSGGPGRDGIPRLISQSSSVPALRVSCFRTTSLSV